METDDPDYKMRIDDYKTKICEDCHQAQEDQNSK